MYVCMYGCMYGCMYVCFFFLVFTPSQLPDAPDERFLAFYDNSATVKDVIKQLCEKVRVKERRKTQEQQVINGACIGDVDEDY